MVVIVGEDWTTTTRVFVFCSGDTDCGLSGFPPARTCAQWPPRDGCRGIGRAGTLGGTRARCIAGETVQLSDFTSKLKLLSFTFH